MEGTTVLVGVGARGCWGMLQLVGRGGCLNVGGSRCSSWRPRVFNDWSLTCHDGGCVPMANGHTVSRARLRR